MNQQPILHVYYQNDDYKEWDEPQKRPHFEAYLQATPGRIFESYGGFDPLDVLSVGEYKITVRLAEESGVLMAGESLTLHYELPGLIADGSGFERFTATIRWLTAEEAAGVRAEPMKDPYLHMDWDYHYDKESTWFDDDSGWTQYQLCPGASYPLPHIWDKMLEIRSVREENGVLCADLFTDHESYTVRRGGEGVVARADDSYMVAGDSVFQNLRMIITLC